MTDPVFETLQKVMLGDMRQVFTPAVVDHAMKPRNVGSLPDADASAAMYSDCGELMEIWLKIKAEHIEDIRFWSDGCGATIACGSMVSELARGKTITQSLKINKQTLIDAFGGLPEGNIHCAILAANTLKKAIRDYLTRR